MARPQSAEHRETIHDSSLIDTSFNKSSRRPQLPGLTVSEYFRRTALNIQIRSRINKKALGELSRMTGLQKHLLMQIVRLPHRRRTSPGTQLDLGRNSLAHCTHFS